MFFRRKPKNRRLGRDYVLDVKLRSSQVRAARTRVAALSLGAIFGSVFGLYILWRAGEWTLNELVYENQSFAIQDIDVQTDGILPVPQLRRWSGVKPGQNLLALDLVRVKRDLEMAPLVQSASIERILPHSIRIRVIEREPVAQINVLRPRPNGGVEMAPFQLDEEGYVILPLESPNRDPSSNQAEPLPVLTGFNPNEIQPGRRLENPQIQAALQLITAFDQSPMTGLADLKRIDVSNPEILVVTTGQGSEITFGLADLELQLCRWHTIFDTGQHMGKGIATVDLAIPNNIPVRWLDAGIVPVAVPKPLKPFHNKRKHV